MKTIPQLMKLIHENAVNKKFWDDPEIEKKTALIMCEGAEALEELRKNSDPAHIYYRESDHKPEGFIFELADVVIRVMDISEACNLNLYGAIREKMDFNLTRPPLHGKEF